VVVNRGGGSMTHDTGSFIHCSQKATDLT